jgi:hypothetical protein
LARRPFLRETFVEVPAVGDPGQTVRCGERRELPVGIVTLKKNTLGPLTRLFIEN